MNKQKTKPCGLLESSLSMFSLVSRRVTQQNVPTFVLRAMSSVPSTMKVSGNRVADVITLAMAFFSLSRLTNVICYVLTYLRVYTKLRSHFSPA